MSANTATQAMKCPVCLETMSLPIIQCAEGHSLCKRCVTSYEIKTCPCCRGRMTDKRNYQLEQLIESLKDVLKINCVYANKGCKYVFKKEQQGEHESQCRFRKISCEGKRFAGWNCSWYDDATALYAHFKLSHPNHCRMEYKTDVNLKISLLSDHRDVQVISFFNGQHYFYYKHKVDVAKSKAYWTFQLLGLESQAQNYYYEFEVHKGPIRKFKVTEICQHDTADTDEIFEKEKCVVMSFAAIRGFLNENNELPFKFRIMSVKKVGK